MNKIKLECLLILAPVLIFSACSLQSNELSKSNSAAGLNGGSETTDSGYPVNWAFGPNPESGDMFQVSVDTAKAQEGKQSLKLTTDQSDRTLAIRSRRIPVQSGKMYKNSFSVQNSGATLKVNRIVQDASGKTHIRSNIIVDTSTPTSDWKTFEETLVVSDGEAQVVLIFLVDGPGSVWIDDVNVEEVLE
jgi:hypothetical protein